MILEKALQEYGLNQKEAKVYLATLELGKATVAEISKKAGLKRPTVYLILEDLLEIGIISRLPNVKKTQFYAENPEFLLTILENREGSIKNILPTLKAMYSTLDKHKPKMRFYEGREGLNKIYDELRQSKKYILFYGSIKDIKANFPDSFLTLEQIKKMNIPVKEIVTSDPVDIEYAKIIDKFDNPKHQIRTVKQGIYFILDSAIFDDKIMIISVKEDYFGVVIDSKDIAYSFKILYELAWQSAKKVKL